MRLLQNENWKDGMRVVDGHCVVIPMEWRHHAHLHVHG